MHTQCYWGDQMGGRGMWHVWGGEERVDTKFRFGNVTDRNHYEDQGVDGGY